MFKLFLLTLAFIIPYVVVTAQQPVRLEFETYNQWLRVGDTIPLRVIAYDASGRVVPTPRLQYTVTNPPGFDESMTRIYVNQIEATGTAVHTGYASIEAAVFEDRSIVTALNLSVLILPSQHLPNPLENPVFFVYQQYRGLLNREPDDSGLIFWADKLRLCNGDRDCLSKQRLGVVCAFITSVEYQQRFGVPGFTVADCGN